MRKIVIRIILLILILGLSGCQESIKQSEETKDAFSEEIKGKDIEPKIIEDKDIKKFDSLLTFSEDSGVYDKAFTLTLLHHLDTDVFYTTDGSDPRTSETRMLYIDGIEIKSRDMDENLVSGVDPVLFDAAYSELNATKDGFINKMTAPDKSAVDKCTVIKAVEVGKDGSESQIITKTYFIGTMSNHIQGISASCSAAKGPLAIISISMEFDDLFDAKKGIYVKGDIFEDSITQVLEQNLRLKASDARNYDANYSQRGREWERNAHIDFFESDGTTSNCVLSQDCGIRIQGNYSRSDLQKGFRLYARADYGEKNFNYAVFGNERKNDSGEVMDKFKTLVLRNGGNCAFTTKYSDTYWQSLIQDLDCETQSSRPCVVYLNGEYWGLYVLQEDYSEDYFEETHGVEKNDVVLYKGDGETYEIGYKLDLGDLPEGVTQESYYFNELIGFFNANKDLSKQEAYEAFVKLVDPDSVRDYFAVEIWINNKWDWPGKNWSMWKTTTVDSNNPYWDGRWRFCFYDMEFGGVSGRGDASANTIKEDNYQPDGMLDRRTTNPAVLCFIYLMSNEEFRTSFYNQLSELENTNFMYETAVERLNQFREVYSPLYRQFFERYPNTGSEEQSNHGVYASYQCIKDFLTERSKYIQNMIDYMQEYYMKLRK